MVKQKPQPALHALEALGASMGVLAAAVWSVLTLLGVW